MSGGNKVKLQSSDNQIFEVDEKVACESRTLKLIIEDEYNLSVPILLPSVSGKILSKVIEYCKYHVQAKRFKEKPKVKKPNEEEPIEEEWDVDFMNFDLATFFHEEKKRITMEWEADFMNVDQATLYNLINAANYLDIKGLLDLTCQNFANMINSLSSKEITTLFNIQNDFPERFSPQGGRSSQGGHSMGL